MKRRVILLLLLLVGGAIVNIAVAWGCACLSPTWEHTSAAREEVESLVFPKGAPPARDFQSFQYRAFGWAHTHASARWLAPEAKHIYDYSSAHVDAWTAGWPMWSMIGWSRHSDNAAATAEWCIKWTREGQRTLVIPCQPHLPGFPINTVFYAAMLWLLFASPFALRRCFRTKRGLCPACAYPVGASAVCTECGRPSLHCPPHVDSR